MKLRPALDWLNDPHSQCDSMGEKSLRSALDDASFIGNKIECDELSINETCAAIDSLLSNLCVFTRDGKVSLSEFVGEILQK